MSKGFTIKCNNCGAESVITEDVTGIWYTLKYDNENIFIYAYQESEREIKCYCCNETVKG